MTLDRRSRWLPALVSLALVLMCTAPVSAAIIPLSAIIDGAQANAGAGTGSAGTGTASITFDTGTNLLSWNVTWSGLTGTETVAHFHGPAPAGVNAGVTVGIAASSPSIGSTVITAPQATDLLAGLWYLNIHTDVHPGGEIRGQVGVIPEPASGMLLACGVVGVLACGRRLRRRP